MPDFTLMNSENWRYPQFSVEPPHIGGGWERVDVSFASFLCAKEKEDKKVCFFSEKKRKLFFKEIFGTYW